ncbi:hypothetical protein C6501_00085 [Candidatus Poribacteria bacterium]|nr:MAG: hypothetical protein C6501_00085 [Candidatus Poribacteria bacterium]
MAVIEERTTWIRGLLYILLAAVVGAIVTPIILHILSNRGKQNSNVATVIVKSENMCTFPGRCGFLTNAESCRMPCAHSTKRILPNYETE